MFNGKAHYKWAFSIAMLVYQRVVPNLLFRISTYIIMVVNFCIFAKINTAIPHLFPKTSSFASFIGINDSNAPT